MATAKRQVPKEIPITVTDVKNKKIYERGQFLGKGGFARCYELKDSSTGTVFAGKIMVKEMISKNNQQGKISQEIAIHRSLNNKHVVDFFTYFEDAENVYILLELCKRRTLMEMHKRRKYLTERETRYFVRQIVLGCQYLHENKIIHRDLKLSNLFLNNDVEIKIGDFGLATRMEETERKRSTFCGTPNYIAPEILSKGGHSFEVDVWSLGCIMYTLLVGKPPFETSCVKDTYRKIIRNEYQISKHVSPSARDLIKKLLAANPRDRPNMKEILSDPFLTEGPPVPRRLPVSCLTTMPRQNDSIWNSISMVDSRICSKEIKRGPAALNSIMAEALSGTIVNESEPCPPDYYLTDLFKQLESFASTNPTEKNIVNEEDAEDPAAFPVYWVSKWVDYSDKYGFAYELCDSSVGVLFNDNTRLIHLSDGINMHYIEKNLTEHYHTLKEFPVTLDKKVKLLQYFSEYMNANLIKTGEIRKPKDGDEIIRLPFLRAWFRTKNAMILHLTNGTLQMNFFQDHAKIILCPLMESVTYINEKQELRTFRLKSLEKFGCSKELTVKLRYGKIMVEKFMDYKRAGKLRQGKMVGLKS